MWVCLVFQNIDESDAPKGGEVVAQRGGRLTKEGVVKIAAGGRAP